MAKPYWYTKDGECERYRQQPAPRRQRRELPRWSAAWVAARDDWTAGTAEAVAAACSAHASMRRAQRHLRIDQLVYVLTYGEQVYRTGAVFHILRRCDIDPSDRCRDDIAHLEGTVVLVEDDTIITVYRNRRSYHQVHKKQKHVRGRPGGRRSDDGGERAA